MRRLFVLLSAALFATVALADSQQKTPGDEPIDRETSHGRAMIVRPARTLTTADRAELAAKGLTLRQPLSGGRYIARLAEGVQLDDARVALEPLTAARKIHRSALRELGRGKTWAEINVIFHDDVTFEEARTAIAAAGAAMADPLKLKFSPSQRIQATIAPAAVDALAADERVLTIAGVPRWKVKTDNAISAALSHVTEIQAAPYNLTGAGVTVSLFELAEAQASHPEFGGRLTLAASGGTGSDKQHATHVAGTIGASGVNAAARGMAPGVRIHQFCVSTPCGGRLTFLEDKEDNLKPLGIVVDNNSWGFVLGWSDEGGFPVWNDAEEYFGAYDLIVGAPLDKFTIQQGILFVHSAGNDGNFQTFSSSVSEHRHVDGEGEVISNRLFCYSPNGSGNDCPSACNGGCETVHHDPKTPFDTLGVTAAAKNVIAVGSLNTVTGQPAISSFSSRGPAKDGRVKPDVVARGSNVLSTSPTNEYSRLGGTSMASPAVTGIAALLTEQWRKTNGNANPTPAILKALIIAGAEDLGNPGPDYTFGFGLVNAQKSADLIIANGTLNNHVRNLSFTDGAGQSFETSILVAQAQNVRAVLNWSDPPIAMIDLEDDIAEKALVNDLDLKVIGPDGTEHRAWVLDPVQFKNNATRGTNIIDNVEMVEIANAAPGVYRVVATGTRVSEGPQTAVLVTSAAAVPPCRDPQETGTVTNNSAETAYGNLVTGQTVSGAICSQGDLDFYKFNVTKAGNVSVTVTADDTPIRATLTGNGVNSTVDVPANSSRQLTLNAATVPLALLLKIEAPGATGIDPGYTVIPQFGETTAPRRRSTRK
ncbi:MAG TPA: S8 family serine peptidase [Thermoanaerobaculia bacterium]|nr:S8 family serine peptidase [Thermoanaerobaculia bacterium]